MEYYEGEGMVKDIKSIDDQRYNIKMGINSCAKVMAATQIWHHDERMNGLGWGMMLLLLS